MLTEKQKKYIRDNFQRQSMNEILEHLGMHLGYIKHEDVVEWLKGEGKKGRHVHEKRAVKKEKPKTGFFKHSDYYIRLNKFK